MGWLLSLIAAFWFSISPVNAGNWIFVPAQNVSVERSVSFNGSDTTISVDDDPALEFSDDISAVVTFKVDTLGGTTTKWNILVSRIGAAGHRVFVLYVRDNGEVWWRTFSDAIGTAHTRTTNSGTISAGTWYTLVVTHDANDDKHIYIDGVENTDNASTGSIGGLYTGANVKLRLGGSDGAVDYLDGNIYRAAILKNAVLSSAEAVEISADPDLDLNTNSGNYTSSGDLVWWQKYTSSTDLETTDAIANAATAGGLPGSGVNMTNAGNLDAATP